MTADPATKITAIITGTTGMAGEGVCVYALLPFLLKTAAT